MEILERAEFQRWRDQPLTHQFLKVLGMRRDNLATAWSQGQPLTPEQQAQAVLLGRLAEVRFEDVAEMAGIETEDETQA
jgi:hypothetical protein